MALVHMQKFHKLVALAGSMYTGLYAIPASLRV